MARDVTATHQSEIEELRLRLAEVEQTLEAIRAGEVDSLVVEGPEGLRVYALEGASNTYRVLIEAMNEGAATLTELGVILYCNSRFARLLELPLERVMGSSIRDRVPDRLQSVLDAILQASKKHEGEGEIRLLNARGEEVPVYLSVNTIEAEGRKVVCLVAVDLRPQKRAEEILAAERLASSVIEHAAEATIVCDETGRIIRASRSAAELCARNPLLSSFEDAFPLVSSSAESSDRGSLMTAVLRGENLRTVPAVLRRGDRGDIMDLLVSAAPLEGRGGRVVGCVVTLVDVTESRRAEEALRAAVSLRDEFLLVASHELRTPLTALSLELEGIEKLLAMGKGDRGRLDKKLHIAITQTDRLEALIASLLNVSRMVSGRFRLEVETFDLADLVRESVERAADVAARAGCEIKVARSGHLIVTWDRSRIDQVVVNLLGNAIKYGPGKPIDVSLDAKNGSVELRVQDRGIGISEADQRRIFGRFERAVSSRHYGGLGLGLFITREIVQAHGGTIQVESIEGSGSTFIVRIPRVVASAKPRDEQHGGG